MTRNDPREPTAEEVWRSMAALREDGPTDADDARMRARLRALGIALPVATTGLGVASGAKAAVGVAGAARAGLGAQAGAQAGWGGGVWTLSWSGKVILTAALLGAVSAGGALMALRGSSSPAAPVEPVSDPRPASRDLSTASTLSPDPETVQVSPVGSDPPAEAGTAEASSLSRRSGAASAPGSGDASRRGSARPGHLAAELQLIERALQAAEAGDDARAREALREHARRFPHGQLTRERRRAWDALEPNP